MKCQAKDAKSEMVMIRMTTDEKDRLNATAKTYDMTLSEYIRFVGLNAEIKVKLDIKNV